MPSTLSRFVTLVIPSLLLSWGSAVPEASAEIWVTREEVRALPTSGVAWNALRKKADLPAGTPNLSDQNQVHDVCMLAKALVYARTGIETYRTEVRQGCMAAINTEVGGLSLALARNLSGYVIAAELVGLEPNEDLTFRAWLRRTLSEVCSDGRTLRSVHEERPNNFGTHAGASRAAVAVYLGDKVELERTALVFRGWLGDRAAYAGFKYGDLSWQCDPAKPVGVNPQGCVRQGIYLDGALPEEMRRGGTFQWPPLRGDAYNYVWEAVQGALVQAEILHRQGYDAWRWQNQGLRRVADFLYGLHLQFGGWWATGDDSWSPWLLNRAYGTKFPAVSPTSPGKNMGWTDWTHASGGPLVPDTSPPASVRDMSRK
jgi:Alginate lyase